MRLVIGSIGVCVVVKTNDEIYVPSAIKIYSYIVTFHLSSLLNQRRSNCLKHRKG